jgi:tetratricopeptide (TPR) repeat protein
LIKRFFTSFLSVASVVAWIATAPELIAHGTHRDLMTQIDADLKAQPENAALWYRRAMLDFEHEDWDRAFIDLDKTEKLAPKKFPILWIKGQILAAQGNYTEAKSTLDDFLKNQPDHSGGLASRARIHFKLGNAEAAIRDFRTALTNIPDAGPDFIQEVSQSLAAYHLTDESIFVIESALKRLGPIPSLQLKLIDIEVAAGRYDQALNRLDTYQVSAPRPEPWMVKRASIFAQADRLAESRAAWQAILHHLNQLPASERNSHAMSLVAEQTRDALSALHSQP